MKRLLARKIYAVNFLSEKRFRAEPGNPSPFPPSCPPTSSQPPRHQMKCSRRTMVSVSLLSIALILVTICMFIGLHYYNIVDWFPF
ncbi:hypothetical protein V3C99_009704 [Haemonchus contortus]